jgi:hypothetical protein
VLVVLDELQMDVTGIGTNVHGCVSVQLDVESVAGAPVTWDWRVTESVHDVDGVWVKVQEVLALTTLVDEQGLVVEFHVGYDVEIAWPEVVVFALTPESSEVVVFW